MPAKKSSSPKPHRYVAFLRGINLGKRRPKMSDLAALFVEMGFAGVQTFIASGNVVFESREQDSTALEKVIAAHLKKCLGYAVDTFVRTAEEVAALARGALFKEDGQEGITIHVAFLWSPLPASAAAALEAVDNGYDELRVLGREFYWLCRGRMSDSTLWEQPEIKALKLPSCTLRNLGSVRKLVAKHFPDLSGRTNGG